MPISDPMPFQFWHRFTSLCEHVTFVDVDYPQLIEKKRALISGCPPLQDALISSTLRYSEPPIYVRSDRYMAVGCDLRDLSTLSQILKPELTAPSCSILFVGEVSLTYMNVDDSDSLIRWANSFPNCKLGCLLLYSCLLTIGQPRFVCWNNIFQMVQNILLPGQC